jgi:hypothetical protein
MLFETQPPTTIVMAGFMPATHDHPCITAILGRRHKAGDDDDGFAQHFPRRFQG